MTKKITRMGLALTIGGLLQCGFPSQSHAIDIEKALIIGGAVTGGLVLVAVIGTALARNNPALMTLMPSQDKSGTTQSRLHFGRDCPAAGPALTVCW